MAEVFDPAQPMREYFRTSVSAAAVMAESDKFYYVYSCDLDISVQLKIGSLEGKRELRSYKAVLADPMLRFSGLYQETCSDMYVTCQVYADGKPLALPVRTSYKAFSTRWNWNEWLKLPVKYADLPRSAQVALTIWDVYGPGKAVPVGGTTVSLFGKYGFLKLNMDKTEFIIFPPSHAISPTNLSITVNGCHSPQSHKPAVLG
ncbi:unnamed protein product [Ranitomeya imitator]|uniref:C2 PI3K-type domain-containing protein n=1 Tax=Ranitomeya imitator TaxID=111125 RepID=A0ABN9M592_9NEOB|nr:unnamed protein product [Ranitomeya imitator]